MAPSFRQKVDYLFSGERLDDGLRNLAGAIGSNVDAIPKDQFLAASDDQLVEHLLPRYQVTPITLYEDRMEMEQFETTVDVHDFGEIIKAKGIVVDVSVPFTGGYNYFHLAPNTNFSVPPRGYVQPSSDGDSGVLHIVKEQANHVPIAKLKQEIEKELRLVRALLGHQLELMERHNQSIPAQLRSAIQSRRQRLAIHQTVPGILGIPLKRKEGAPNFQPLAIQRKLIRPLPAAKPGELAEPGIAEDIYLHILEVIRHVGRTFEATPRTYAVHEEEELRDIILANLNGHYKGAATGEAFRKSGKTDIKVEEHNRSAFVAECKIWRGGKEFAESIDQLLHRYLTWRDCKAALLVFNKHIAKFSEILSKIPEQIKVHPKYVREIASVGGEWKVQFRSVEDDNRLITVTIFVFNIFVSDSKPK